MGRAAALKALATAVASLGACGCTELPPLGEAVLWVDTDVPVPKIAGRLRLDLYRSDGSEWYESRDIALPDPRDWPCSFSLYDPDETAARSALVRLRVYPSGRTRDYLGERYSPRPIGAAPSTPWEAPPPPPGETPRLVIDGVDRTPPTEPHPLVTIDRLFVLDLEPGTSGIVSVRLHGACLGTMADLAGRASCVGTEAALEPVVHVLPDPDADEPSSRVGSFGADRPCEGTPRPAGVAADGSPLYDEERCVPGGIFLFGNADALSENKLVSGLPERPAVVPPFMLDRYEVTVGRWRAALAAGFVSPDVSPVANDADLPATASADDWNQCTWSSSPRGRESFPITCVTPGAARAFCQFLGADLLSEAEWEYAAQAVGRPDKLRYPWGSGDPDCARAIYGRANAGSTVNEGGNVCVGSSLHGPQPVDTAANGDVTPLGIVDLAGNAYEVLLDAFYPFDSACVVATPLTSPVCVDLSSPTRTLRGASWASPSFKLYLGTRAGALELASAAATVGFRCARRDP